MRVCWLAAAVVLLWGMLPARSPAGQVSQGDAVRAGAAFMRHVGWDYAALEHEVVEHKSRLGKPLWRIWYYRPRTSGYAAEALVDRRCAEVCVDRSTGQVFVAVLDSGPRQAEETARRLTAAELAATAQRYAQPFLPPGQVGQRECIESTGPQHSFVWPRVHQGIRFIGDGVAIDMLPSGRLCYFAQNFSTAAPTGLDNARLPRNDALATAHRLAEKAGVPFAALKVPAVGELVIMPPPRATPDQPSRLIWLVHVAKGTGNGAEVHLDGHTGELLHYYAAMGDLTAKLKPPQPAKPPASRPKPQAAKPTALPLLGGAVAVLLGGGAVAWAVTSRRRRPPLP